MRRARGMAAIAAVAMVCACGKKDEGGGGGGSAAPAPAGQTGPVRIAFGNCAGASTHFVSGPKPVVWTAEQVEAIERASQPAPDLDRGKMGREDSTRETGRYARPKPDGELAELGSTADFSGGLDDRQLLDGLPDPAGSSGRIDIGTVGTRPGTPRPRGRIPRVLITTPTVEGDLDRNIIRRYIRRKLPMITECYKKRLAANEDLGGGRIDTGFTILPNGVPQEITADGFDHELAGCVADVLRTIQFPKPRGGGFVKVTYPFAFEPPPPKPVAGEPGAHNPLRPAAEQLEACLRKQTTQLYGAAVVELTVDDKGAVTASTTHGVDDAAVAACIATAARAVTYQDAAGSTRRCGFAFGTMTVAQAPGIDIDATAVRVGGFEIGKVATLVADDDPSWKLPALEDALRPGHAVPPKQVVMLAGPVVLRAVDGAPMKVVNRVLLNAGAARATPALAVERDGAWRLVRGERELPEVPIPYRADDLVGILGIAGRERAEIAVLIDTDAVWVGLSVTRDLRKVANTDNGPDWVSVESVLRKLADARAREGATTAQIAGADETTYGQVIDATEHVARAGLTDWQLVTPSGLAVRFRE